jgi:hypothetical protein
LTWRRIWSAALSVHLPVSPWYAEFYAPEHPSRGLPLTLAILERFVDEARRRGRQPLLGIIPTIRDFSYRKAQGEWPFAPLKALARKRGLTLLDIDDGLFHQAAAADLCDLFCTDKGARTGHYTEAGNRLLAEVLQGLLQRPGVPRNGG